MSINKNSAKDYFNEKASEWDNIAKHDEKKVSFIVDALGIKSGDKVLDVGCGTGVLIPFLYDKCKSALAIDEAEKMIEVARGKYNFPNVKFQAINFENVSGQFDKIIMYSMFPHFTNQSAAIKHAAGLLKRGGRLMIAHSQSRDEINALHEDMDAVLPDAKGFAKLFKAAGLKTIQNIDNNEMFVMIAEK